VIELFSFFLRFLENGKKFSGEIFYFVFRTIFRIFTIEFIPILDS